MFVIKDSGAKGNLGLVLFTSIENQPEPGAQAMAVYSVGPAFFSSLPFTRSRCASFAAEDCPDAVLRLL
jgi:hypothetical protein